MEVASVDEGVARYRASREARPSSTGTPEQRFIKAAMDKLVPAVEDLQYAYLTRQPMPGIHKWGPTVVSLPADKLSLLTLRSVFEGREGSTVKVGNAISKAIALEQLFERIRKEDPEQFQSTRKFTKRWTEDNVRLMAKRSSVGRDTKRNQHVGAVLLQAAIEHTGIVCLGEKYNGRPKPMKTVCLHPAVEEEINRQHDELAYMRNYYQPMVVPPKDWTTLHDGGYYYTPLRLVKSSWKQHHSITEFSQVGENVDAVNKIQSVPWKINTRVLEVVKELHRMGSRLGGLTPDEDLPLPPKPEDILTNAEANQRWRRKAREVYEDNDKLKAKRKVLLEQIHLATEFSGYSRIYFVWQLDWRGRMYPVMTNLSPQGDDVGRALLLFAEGKPLGERGYYWLTVHLANQMGLDKEEFKDRIGGVHARKREILGWADDPLSNRGWADADEPFKCLAAAIEWAEATRLEQPGDYVSHIPVAMDGSCNGLQHLSAIGRDPEGATSTNLVRTQRPNDIYRMVAGRLLESIRKDLQSPDEPVRDHAAHWFPRVDRSLCKRPTMTTPYSVTKQGIRMQLMDDGFLRSEELGELEINASANYIRDRMHEAIGEVVVAAREIMDWLKLCAGIKNQQDETLRWTTPTGFYIDQSYIRLRRAHTQTVLQDLQYWVPFDERKLFPQRQINGIAPNFIHSMDASHLTMVVNTLWYRGVRAFAAVHDSFGTHAADVDLMHKVIREEFVKLHQADLLEMFRQDNGGLPPPPEKGEFELEGVLDAEYAFS